MFESTQSSLATVPPAPGAGAPRERLLSLSTEVPSAAGVAYLAGLDLGAWDAFDRVLALTAWERHRSWFEGCLQHALVAVGGPAPTDSRDDDWARKEVACTLRLSTTTAGMRLGVARELTGRLARTGRALQDGAIGYRHAQSLTDALAGFDDALARRVEAAVLVGGHPQETLSEFRKRLARAVIAADPASADERHETAVGTRRV
ncbi:MAG: DUF222 domain-containing protein, partial [Actinomycetota bacterium]